MSKVIRISLATIVLSAATATPALATPSQPVTTSASLGLCKIVPRWCQLGGAQLPLDQPNQ